MGIQSLRKPLALFFLLVLGTTACYGEDGGRLSPEVISTGGYRPQRLLHVLLSGFDETGIEKWRVTSTEPSVPADLSRCEIPENEQTELEIFDLHQSRTLMHRPDTCMKIDPRGRFEGVTILHTPAIHVKGVVKTISFLIKLKSPVGKTSVVIEDVYGIEYKIPLFTRGSWYGWNKVTVAVPPTIMQFDFTGSGNQGITFKGLEIRETDDETESIGLGAVTAVADFFFSFSDTYEGVTNDW